jgi:hypothetical protein
MRSWDPNRRGPVDIPANATTCTVLYDTPDDFSISAASA